MVVFGTAAEAELPWILVMAHRSGNGFKGQHLNLFTWFDACGFHWQDDETVCVRHGAQHP